MSEAKAEAALRRWAKATPEERAEHGRKVSEGQLRRWAERLGPKEQEDEPRHGRASTYTNHGCRCDECRDAWRVYFNERRRKAAKARGERERT